MISHSPERHTFQQDKAEVIGNDIVEIFEKIRLEHKRKFDDPKTRENNLEYDLRTTDWILEKVRKDDNYAQHLYAALCNNDFQKLDVIPILKDLTWSCSWRYAGGIIADMQQKGDYINWYCSGINGPNDEATGKIRVAEGEVTDEVREDLKKLGWTVK
jgi:hypothetical protein